MNENRKYLIDKYSKPTYIGDSVYIHFDGYHFVLETRNGLPTDPSNSIAIEPKVWSNFDDYRRECYENFRLLEEWEEKQKEGKELNERA